MGLLTYSFYKTDKLMQIKHTLIGSLIAFILATACCWLPLLALVLGGALGIGSLADGLGKWSGVFFGLGVALMAWSGYRFWQKNIFFKKGDSIIFHSVITCPKCHFSKKETMPTNSCQFFYECTNCQQILKPKQGACCVFCSYGTVKCPPMQTDNCHC